MPELPEITRLAAQMDAHLEGKTVSVVEVVQPKCLNLPVDALRQALAGAVLGGSTARGKWVQTQLSNGWLLLNLGMGGEVLLVDSASLPKKRRAVLGFSDGSCLSINFWWFGYLHYLAPEGLAAHAMTARLGPNALDLGLEEFRALLQGSRGSVKAFLLDQSRIAGIGNAYVHDILFLARLHPLRKLETLTPTGQEALYNAVRQGLQTSLDKGAAWYEVDLFGKPGGFTQQDILIGYKEGKPCPSCGSAIVKIKTGSTTSYICPSCQPQFP